MESTPNQNLGACTIDFDVVKEGVIVGTTSNGERQREFSVREEIAVPGYFTYKAWPTRIVGAALLLVTSPLILLLTIVVRLTSAGPGLFRQTRTGRHGKEFTMYKIRTMYKDAETVTGPVWCTPNDSRITPVGRILRLLHLDELPQLINIARGEMDLIGPRPERPVFVARLVREVPGYSARLKVLPGVTGLAQINLPPDETTDCVRKKLMLDCSYIAEADVFMDLRIMVCTMLRMLGIRHGRAVRWLGLRRQVPQRAEWHGKSLDARMEGARPDYQPVATTSVNGHSMRLAIGAARGDAIDSLSDVDSTAPDEFASLFLRRPR